MIKNQNTINIARNISQANQTSLLNITGHHLLVLTPSQCDQCLIQKTSVLYFLEFLLSWAGPTEPAWKSQALHN